MSKPDVDTKDLQGLLSKSEAELKELAKLLREGVEQGKVYLSRERTHSSVAFLAEFVDDAKMRETSTKDRVKVLSTMLDFCSAIIHKAKAITEVKGKFFNLSAAYDEKAALLAKQLLDDGVISDFDYMEHRETPGLEMPLISGTAKLRKLVSPLNKQLYPCADVTVGINDDGKVRSVHFEASLKELGRLIDELTDVKEAIQKMPKVMAE